MKDIDMNAEESENTYHGISALGLIFAIADAVTHRATLSVHLLHSCEQSP